MKLQYDFAITIVDYTRLVITLESASVSFETRIYLKKLNRPSFETLTRLCIQYCTYIYTEQVRMQTLNTCLTAIIMTAYKFTILRSVQQGKMKTIS